jgi:hypothetical protein
MVRAIKTRFVPAALIFLLLCVSVLALAAASTLVAYGGWQQPELRAHILFTLLR